MSFVERVNQGESLASWLYWLSEPPAVCWSVIMGDLSPSHKGVYWTHPEAFRTGTQTMLCTACSPETPNSGPNLWFFVHCNLENSQINRAPPLTYFKLCTPFHSHQRFATGVTVHKLSIWVKISDFLSLVTLKFDRWHSKTIGHLACATWSFVHHVIAVWELKQELQSGNS